MSHAHSDVRAECRECDYFSRKLPHGQWNTNFNTKTREEKTQKYTNSEDLHKERKKGRRRFQGQEHRHTDLDQLDTKEEDDMWKETVENEDME